MAAARQTRRVNLFHPEDGLPPVDRAELADYARSGFDRGHMTPSGDMPDPVAQQQLGPETSMPTLKPYADNAASMTIGDLALENGRVSAPSAAVWT